MKLDRTSLIVLSLALFLSLVSAFVVAINICSKDWDDVGSWAAGGALSTMTVLLLINAKHESDGMCQSGRGPHIDDSVPADSPYPPSGLFFEHRESDFYRNT